MKHFLEFLKKESTEFRASLIAIMIAAGIINGMGSVGQIVSEKVNPSASAGADCAHCERSVSWGTVPFSVALIASSTLNPLAASTENCGSESFIRRYKPAP